MTELNEFKRIIEDVLKELNLELYNFSFHGGIFRVIVDKSEGDVSLADCEKASLAIGRIFDERDLIVHRYRLEVSSPGLDREIRKREEYIRFKGYLVRINFKEQDEQRYVLGRIKEVQEDKVELEIGKGTKTIAIKDILKAHLEPELK